MAERASGVEGVRRTNLGEILRSVHRQGPRSRSVLTAETGLNRSTVADLVAELVAQGLVVEQEPDPTRRVGRPSPIVAPSTDVVAIAVNPEVDAIEVGAVSLGGTLRLRVREERTTVPSVDDVVQTVRRIVSTWIAGELAGSRVIGVGLAVPALVAAGTGLVRLAPHLGWRDVDVIAPLSEALGISVAVDNDASLGAKAERLFGAAREHQNVVYLNGGASGIGGGLILQDILIGGAGGFAGEWGQTRPGIARASDRRTEDGVLEDEVNRARLMQVAGLAQVDDAALAASLLGTEDIDVIAEMQRQRRILAAALANSVNVLNPSIIVLGGFLAILRDLDTAAFDDEVRSNALGAPAEGLEIQSAALGQDRLLIGAAEAVFELLLADPLAI